MPQTPRTILAVVLSLAVLIIYYTWFAPPPPVGWPQPSPEKKETAPPEAPPAPSGLQPAEDRLNLTQSETPTTPVREIIFENDEIKAVFSTKGGALKHWSLKKFHTGADETSPFIDLINGAGEGDGTVSQGSLTQGSLTQAFRLSLEGGTEPTEPVYTVESEQENELVLSFQGPTMEIRKRIVLNSRINPHVLDLTVELVNRGDKPVDLEPRLWINRPQKAVKKGGGFFGFLTGPPDLFVPDLFVDGKLKVFANWEKLAPKNEERGKIYWSGLTDRYFFMGIIARQAGSAREGVDGVSAVYGKSAGDGVYNSLSYGGVTLNPGEKIQRRFSAYLGPKKREELKILGVNLEHSVDYGWFSFVAIPILWLLIFFHKIIPNWGIAIIVLTFFVKLLLHPINVKAMQSMKAMQKLQPRLTELRQKYKDNKEKLNVEMMQLFKTHKVNPMGGCLPLLIQMPVYIALYKVLYNAIELYHAPFFWFYRDLSAPDPYLITPILLGILMAAQQKLTPSPSADPAQQKMMMIMPIMFSAFMIFLPSGLVIYIMVNTIMSVVQQYMIHREIGFLDLVKKIRYKT
ncbi:MAG: membrane protein insertase YidC [Deltaproteobacteria bacterium]|nr:membrane protein insertase YidC [Deltaproteobacteria bacterium]